MKSILKRLGLLCVIVAGILMLGDHSFVHADQKDDDPVIVVSLGDSFSSGEGITPFYGEDLDRKDRLGNYNWLAHRSTLSWSGQIVIPEDDNKTSMPMNKYHVDVYQKGEKSSDPDKYQWYFVAASGARTKHFKNPQKKEAGSIFDLTYTQVNLPPQLDVFNEIEGTVDYVVFTIGGNDVGFVPVIEECVMRCSILGGRDVQNKIDDIWNLFYHGGINSEGEKIEAIRESIKKAYKDVHDKAPEATILVVGYPKLLYSDLSQWQGFLDIKEAEIVNQAVVEFNKQLLILVNECREKEKWDIHFVDVLGEFDGHEAYSDDPWLNSIKPFKRGQDLVQIGIVSNYSMHPNEKGAQHYAACVNRKIAQLEEIKRGESTDQSKETEIEVLTDGTCGEDLRWIITEDGVLVISGTGKMYDYNIGSDGASTAPWIKSADKIKTININEGVTGIGSGAFAGCSTVTMIDLPRSLQSVNTDAFTKCSRLAEVSYRGSEDEWTHISIGEGNECLTAAAFWFVSKDFEGSVDTVYLDSGSVNVDLVTHQQSFDYKYRLPKIREISQEIEGINNEIIDSLRGIVRDLGGAGEYIGVNNTVSYERSLAYDTVQNDNGANLILNIDYESAEYENILCVRIKNTVCTLWNERQFTHYMVYAVDLSTGHRLYGRDILDRFAVTEEGILDQLKYEISQEAKKLCLEQEGYSLDTQDIPDWLQEQINAETEASIYLNDFDEILKNGIYLDSTGYLQVYVQMQLGAASEYPLCVSIDPMPTDYIEESEDDSREVLYIIKDRFDIMEFVQANGLKKRENVEGEGWALYDPNDSEVIIMSIGEFTLNELYYASCSEVCDITLCGIRVGDEIEDLEEAMSGYGQCTAKEQSVNNGLLETTIHLAANDGVHYNVRFTQSEDMVTSWYVYMESEEEMKSFTIPEWAENQSVVIKNNTIVFLRTGGLLYGDNQESEYCGHIYYYDENEIVSRFVSFYVLDSEESAKAMCEDLADYTFNEGKNYFGHFPGEAIYNYSGKIVYYEATDEYRSSRKGQTVEKVISDYKSYGWTIKDYR